VWTPSFFRSPLVEIPGAGRVTESRRKENGVMTVGDPCCAIAPDLAARRLELIHGGHAQDGYAEVLRIPRSETQSGTSCPERITAD
jgi:hypothetical protein